MLENRIEKYWDKRADSYNEVVQKEMACQKKEAWESLLQKYAGQGENLQVLDVGTGPEESEAIARKLPMFAICASK